MTVRKFIRSPVWAVRLLNGLPLFLLSLPCCIFSHVTSYHCFHNIKKPHRSTIRFDTHDVAFFCNLVNRRFKTNHQTTNRLVAYIPIVSACNDVRPATHLAELSSLPFVFVKRRFCLPLPDHTFQSCVVRHLA